MNRLLCILFLLLTLACNKSEKLRPPNILWLTYEDTSPQYIGCYGNSNAQTQVMDKLASEGVRFTSAFSTGTVCSPSRFTLITGCRTTSYGTGHHRSNYAVPEGIEAFPKYLREAGYYTSNNSKTDYNTSKHRHFTSTAWNESSNSAGWWKRKPGQPFFAVFNSSHSHQSRTMTNPWWKYKEQVLDSLTKEEIIHENDIDMPPIFRDTPEMMKEHTRVYNGIQLTDKHFGRILKQLEAEGLRDSTIIFCFSDHGEGITGGKCHPRGMGYRVPFIIWFPEMYEHLSPWGTKVVTSDVIDFADLPPSLLSLAGVNIPAYVEGTPLLGDQAVKSKPFTFGGVDRSGENLSLSRSISDGQYIFNKHFMPFQPEMRWMKYFDYSQSARLIRKDHLAGNLDKTQAAFLDDYHPETFYDLENDPWEIDNLIDVPELEAQKDKMKSKLMNDLIQMRDAHFIPEYSIKLRKKSPYSLAADRDFYPAEEVIATAFLCGDENSLEHHLEAMTKGNDLLRYWATIGVYTNFTLYGRNIDLPDLALADNYPPADVFLQAIWTRFFGEKKARNKLIDYISGNNEELGVTSAQLLLLEDNYNTDILNRIIEACATSEFAAVREAGELFELKFMNQALHYENFW